ncbi:MAG: hypothetical protein ACOC57_03325 [Acidobacteriota bacterium]
MKTDYWEVKQPGFEEVDLVSHSGESGLGEFIYSLNLIDICTQWVETQAVMGKSQIAVLEALKKITKRLPFALLGLDSDKVLNLESSFFFGYTDTINNNPAYQANHKWLPPY